MLPRPSSGPPAAAPVAAIVLAVGLLVAPSPSAAWEVRCSDALYCTATTNGASGDGRPVRFKLERANAPDGPVFVTAGPDVPLSTGLDWEIDVLGLDAPYGVYGDVGRVWAGNETTFSGPARRPLVENLRRGTVARVTFHFADPPGTVAYSVPLAGLTLALLEIDRRQNRMDREDAIVAWGGLPAASSPEPDPAPAAETVSSAIVYDSGELAPAVAQIGRDRLNCALDDAVPAFGAQVHTLANGQVLSVVPCHFGDVNIESFVVIANGAGGGDARLVRFQRPLGEDPEPRGTIINPRWEPSVRRLTSTRYDSPNSDCGTFEIHEPMPGTAGFELVQVRQKAQCDGSATPAENYPLAWSIEEMGR